MADFQFRVDLQVEKLVQQAQANASANRALAETTRQKQKQIRATVEEMLLPLGAGNDRTNQPGPRDLEEPAAHRLETPGDAEEQPKTPVAQMWLMAVNFQVEKLLDSTDYATCSLALNSPWGGFMDSVVFNFDNCEEFSGNYNLNARPPIYYDPTYDKFNFQAPPLARYHICTKRGESGNQPGALYTYTNDGGDIFVGATWEFGEGVVTYELRPTFDLFGGEGTNVHCYAGDMRGGYEQFEVYNAPDIQGWLLPYKWNEAYFVVHYTPPKSYWVDYCYSQEVFGTSELNVSFYHVNESGFSTAPEGLYRGNISQATYGPLLWQNYWNPEEGRMMTYPGSDYVNGELGQGIIESLSQIKIFKCKIDPINYTQGSIEEIPINETIRFNLEIPFPPFHKSFGQKKIPRETEAYATYESAMINDSGVGSGMNQKTYETTKRPVEGPIYTPWAPPFGFTIDEINEKARVGTMFNFPYSDRPHRKRLLPQGYGIGRLLTDDHMNFNVMVPSPPPEDWYNVKLWFHDAMYYTPMVYDYFTTFMAQSATPALSDAYDDVYTRATRAPEETIIDKNEKGEWVEKKIYTPSSIMIDVNQAGPNGGIQLSLFDSWYGDNEGKPYRISDKFLAPVVRTKNIAGLREATHYAYNWGHPWYCYDQLLAFGIPEDVLGPRPAFDYNKSIPEFVW